ncbi:thiolase C-terminal domain-containing protein [Dethiosulfatarculus sandiegensis]|uniref:Thiolase n=1 Tax=Dethiosulfatarculus sandiegensis TaxID=1429043 RepID=A0A0D2K1P4_9BACT|nr:hypothetical protein [Dethiosulfatarculus sandiegensis]KIX15600.1 thiolase [Dethiosulfatarculus sandiegensis]
MPQPVYVAGAALTPFGRSRESLVDLLAAAAKGAMDQAGVKELDAVYLGVMNPEGFTGDGNLSVSLADRLNISGAASSRVETASSTGAGALESAFFAVASGYCTNVLVVAGEKMTGLSTKAATRLLAQVIDKGERRYGASMPGLAGLIARAYAEAHGMAEERLLEGLCMVAMKNHARGALNPYAQFRKEITPEKYFSSRKVADPLCLYDCAPITDGAAAVVLSREKGAVRLAGVGHATDSSAVTRRGSLTSFNSTRQAAMRAYAMARINPQEVDFAEVHDAFTMFEVIGSEDLGFFPPGGGLEAALEGRTSVGGEIPINCSGGLKARGHPVGASGLAQVVEACWLLTGEVEKPQRLGFKPQVALTQSIGGLGNNNLVSILTLAAREIDEEGPWQPSFAPALAPLTRARPEPPPGQAHGRLLSHTVLHNPPEGFEAPLRLGLVRTKAGWGSLAHLKAGENPVLGGKVVLELQKGFYQARAVSDLAVPWLKARDLWRSLPVLARRFKRRRINRDKERQAE